MHRGNCSTKLRNRASQQSSMLLTNARNKPANGGRGGRCNSPRKNTFSKGPDLFCSFVVLWVFTIRMPKHPVIKKDDRITKM